MNITIITAFPEFFRDFLSTSMIGRAVKKGILTVDVEDLREHGSGSYRQVDDYSFGGKGGMVLLPGVLKDALDSVRERKGPGYVVSPSPQGDLLSQEVVETLAAREHIILICGHYEGLDERFVEKYVDRELSLGDFVLTGGEIPAMALVDAMARLVPGVIGKETAVTEDSFYRGMLDHPHFTRPSEWEGERVPEQLLSGNDAEISKWRRGTALKRTLARRPDLIARANIRPYLPGGVYAALVHSPVLDRRGDESTAAVTGLDISDIARSCRVYGVDRFLITTPLASQRALVKTMARHWTEGWGSEVNPERKEALGLLKVFSTVERAVAWVSKREKAAPVIIGTTAREQDGQFHWLEVKRMILREEKPVLLLFGTGSGLHEDIFAMCTAVLRPISGGDGEYRHLSVRAAAAVVLDRLFGGRS